ncbi:MAG: putative zinc-binding protein [Armatimonadota bacterium]
MSEETMKVGVISCSGEEIPEGTISRLATRRVLELLRAGNTVTICLPLFLAGNEAEREFARTHPTITVDGCSKMCAKHATEKYSGTVSASLVVSDILNDGSAGYTRSTKDRTDADKEAVWAVSERIASEVDALLAHNENCCTPDGSSDTEECACTKPLPGMKIDVNGRSVTIAGLAMIFDNLAETGLVPDDSSGDKLLETVRIYHSISSDEEQDYRSALISAYKAYRR